MQVPGVRCAERSPPSPGTRTQGKQTGLQEMVVPGSTDNTTALVAFFGSVQALVVTVALLAIVWGAGDRCSVHPLR